ncbi:serine/threonine-protein kinase [Terriglobus sp. TAA 43]|uniref:serine/threonine-protein kinase n=1 Tax=Terriglobus sp. TAA 43 TaxID=278961 RepID=UPI00068D8D90|nr:serine/threonine-protein kinase [Terriglobus sp. TAA 43]
MEGLGPRQYGPYVVLEQIGSGGMGAVYRARDRRLERDVAIKVLHRNLEMAGARDRFLREARAVSSLNHPNISTIFDIGEQDGDPYLVMELLHGESIKDRLHDGVPVLEDELISIAMQAAQALAAAHAKGIVHRDIKPANLFLVDGPDGEVQLKVLDFGLAKVEHDRILLGPSGLTRTGATVGTVEYMSPEQARGEDLDPRSDLFSLGAVLYELATGDVPFRGATSAVVFAELLGSEPIPPRKVNTELSTGMDSIIQRLLQKKRENRTPSANALLEELRKLKGPSGSSTVSNAHPSSSSHVRATRVSREPVSVSDPTARSVHGHAPSGTRTSAMRSTPRDSAVRGVARGPVIHSPSSFEREVAAGGIRWWIPATVVALVLAAVGAFLYLRQRGSAVGGQGVISTGLQVTQFDNNTGDNLLQDVPAIAMQILLREMPSLHVTGYAPPLNSNEPDAQEIARRSGADAYLTGSVSRDGNSYHIHAQILRTSDKGELAAEDVDASSAVEIPNALSRLAVALRTHLGESPDQASANTVPLANEATNSLNALSLYAKGMAYLRAGQITNAIDELTRALADDPSFVPARLALVETLRESGAQVERLRAATALKAAATKGSPCQQSRIAYETTDAASAAMEAAQAWSNLCSLQPEAHVAMARSLLAAGRTAEAESIGTTAVQLDPAGRIAVSVATEAMIAQAHYESAQKEQGRAASLNAASPGLALLAAYLRNDQAAETQWAAVTAASNSFSDYWYYLTYLGDRGRLAEAHSFGTAAFTRLSAQPQVVSSAALLHARLDAMEAMAGHCHNELPSIAEAGDTTKFYAGLAKAWCKHSATDSLPADAAQKTLIQAAVLWSTGDPQGALNLLQEDKTSAQSTVAVLLRGESYLKLGQQVLAIGDFKAALTRRGEALLTGTLAYPVAQAGLATSYRTMGDDPNASRAEDDLKNLWKDADPSEPLLRGSN